VNPIKSIELQNFQSHAKTIIEPAGPGFLTVITGPSDSGKTAIIRALKWLLYNQPQGAEFTRTGASMVRVAVDYVGGVTVVRERTASTNRYKILQPGTEKPQVFEGFGSSVPLEVQEITGVRPIKIADQELLLNLSEQLDPPFLGQKSTTAPARAKILGKLAGTEEIDVAGAETGRDLYRRGQDDKRLSAEIEEMEKRIGEFAWIEELGERIAKLELLLAGIKERQARLATLEQKRGELLQIQTEMIAAQKILRRWNVLPAIEAAVKGAEVAAVRCKTLKTLGMKLTDIRYGIEEAQEMIYRLRGIEKAENIARQTGEGVARIKLLHNLNIKLGLINEKATFCRADLESPRVAYLEQLAAAVKNAENAATRAGELAIFKGRLNEITASKAQVKRILQQWETRLPELQQKYLETLMAAGVCPMCGSTEFNITRLKEVV
jgi:exonuclease SbcC